MSVEAITWALRQPVKPSTCKFVLVVLANCASGDTFLAYPSVAYLCDATGQDRKTVLANLTKLREWGLVEDTGKRTGVTKQVVVYRVMCAPDLFGNSPKNGTVPVFPVNSTVFPLKQSQKRDTEPSGTVKEPTAKADARSARGTRLPDGWVPSTDLMAFALGRMSPDEANEELDKFRDHWKSASGAKGVKLDWDATFRNWIRNAKRKPGANHATPVRLSAVERVRANVIAAERRDAEAAGCNADPCLVATDG